MKINMRDTMIHPVERSLWKVWFERLFFAFMIAFSTISLLLLTSIIYRNYYNYPPIEIKTLNPSHLGTICPNDALTISNHIRVNDDVILTLYVSTIDNKNRYNIIGTQYVYTGILYPLESTFIHNIPWTVPKLEPGSYTRVFAVRDISRNDDSIFITSTYNIGEDCP